jgi:hypothetical protein
LINCCIIAVGRPSGGNVSAVDVLGIQTVSADLIQSYIWSHALARVCVEVTSRCNDEYTRIDIHETPKSYPETCRFFGGFSEKMAYHKNYQFCLLKRHTYLSRKKYSNIVMQRVNLNMLA